MELLENQIVEWKSAWRDEYLEWVCGFANAQGGRLEIGRDDKGSIVGLTNATRLLEMLPNKIRTTLGIVADVNLQHDSGKEYIVITVGAHRNAISYRGKFYYRTGSTNQELTGIALDEFMLGKYGKTWDSLPVPHLKPKDLYRGALDAFREKAVSNKRLLQKDVDVSDAKLLQALKLTEGEYLLRAAALVFHQDPERWCLGSYVKIGYFEDDAKILYQDEINGPLITVPDRVTDTIFIKYFKGLIRYEGNLRIDDYPMPREALREAVYNAVVHKDYSTCNPILIRIYDDKVIIYNDYQPPVNVRLEELLDGGVSWQHNPLIANAFFRSGEIEAWGRGIKEMRSWCVADGVPEPEFDIKAGKFSVCFHIRDNNKAIAERKAQKADNREGGGSVVPKDTINGIANDTNNGTINGMTSGTKDGAISLGERSVRLLEAISDNPEITYDGLSVLLGVPRRTVSREMKALQDCGKIERVGARKNGRWVVKTARAVAEPMRDYRRR
jgi:ATP-dependent DNA helicase RecG